MCNHMVEKFWHKVPKRVILASKWNFERGLMLIDSGHQLKLEQFGPYRLIRPSSQALWAPRLPKKEWERADASFSRDGKEGWEMVRPLPSSWEVEVAGIHFQLKPTAFGHLGIFPEQAPLWSWIQQTIHNERKKITLLNLFAYTGGATFAAALGGASVTHVDAAKGMLLWAKENARLNQLEKASIRYIIEDARKFLSKEKKRGVKYDAIILDPPTFGRGNRGEVFKIERELPALLDECVALFSSTPLFLLLSSHTPGYTPLVLKQLLMERLGSKGAYEAGEMVLPSHQSDFLLPSGTFVKWTRK